MSEPPPPFQPEYYSVVPGSTPPPAGLAVASMVCGIVSIPLLCAWPVAIPLGIVAVVLGFVAKGHVRRGTGGGSGMAMAGIICGAVPLVFVAVVILVAIAAAITAALASSGGTVHHP